MPRTITFTDQARWPVRVVWHDGLITTTYHDSRRHAQKLVRDALDCGYAVSATVEAPKHTAEFA